MSDTIFQDGTTDLSGGEAYGNTSCKLIFKDGGLSNKFAFVSNPSGDGVVKIYQNTTGDYELIQDLNGTDAGTSGFGNTFDVSLDPSENRIYLVVGDDSLDGGGQSSIYCYKEDASSNFGLWAPPFLATDVSDSGVTADSISIDICNNTLVIAAGSTQYSVDTSGAVFTYYADNIFDDVSGSILQLGSTAPAITYSDISELFNNLGQTTDITFDQSGSYVYLSGSFEYSDIDNPIGTKIKYIDASDLSINSWDTLGPSGEDISGVSSSLLIDNSGNLYLQTYSYTYIIDTPTPQLNIIEYTNSELNDPLNATYTVKGDNPTLVGDSYYTYLDNAPNNALVTMTLGENSSPGPGPIVYDSSNNIWVKRLNAPSGLFGIYNSNFIVYDNFNIFFPVAIENEETFLVDFKVYNFAATTPLCFVSGTKILTDQGEIKIEKVTKKNTINKNKIHSIPRTVFSGNKIIKIKKNAFGINKPYADTIITPEHRVYEKEEYIHTTRILDLVNNDTIIKIDANKEVIYSIVLENKHDYMYANGLKVETTPLRDVPKGF